MTNQNNDDEMSREDHEHLVNHIYVNHISPMEKDMISMKKDLEFQGRDLSTLKTLVHELMDKMNEGIALTRKTYWLLVGGGMAAVALFAIIKFAMPMIGAH